MLTKSDSRLLKRSWSLNRWLAGAEAKRKLLLDELSRKLDEIERTVPMLYSYERIDPYIVEKNIAGVEFLFIVYHQESKIWFSDCKSDTILLKCQKNNLVTTGDVVFDLGCNSGFMTSWFAKKVGRRGQVHGFDPFPWNTAATYYSALVNGCRNVKVHTVGIAREGRKLRLPYCDCRIYENSAIPQNMCFDAVLAPLDDYSKHKPNLIKVDIEGAERELLAGATKILQQTKKPTFVMEMHHDYIDAAGANPDDIPKQLTSCGYVCFENAAYSGPVRDGLVPTSRSCALFAIPSTR